MPKGKRSIRISEGKRPGSVAMKKRVRLLYKEGLTPKNISRETGIPFNTVRQWVADLPKHSTGFSRRKHGVSAARIARITGRSGPLIRQEMEDKENNPCFFCGNNDWEKRRGWFYPCFHHDDTGKVERAHMACNAVRRHCSRL